MNQINEALCDPERMTNAWMNGEKIKELLTRGTMLYKKMRDNELINESEYNDAVAPLLQAAGICKGDAEGTSNQTINAATQIDKALHLEWMANVSMNNEKIDELNQGLMLYQKAFYYKHINESQYNNAIAPLLRAAGISNGDATSPSNQTINAAAKIDKALCHHEWITNARMNNEKIDELIQGMMWYKIWRDCKLFNESRYNKIIARLLRAAGISSGDEAGPSNQQP